MIRKLSNTNYLHDVPAERTEANERNRKYIDRFVSENYNGLVAKFSPLDGTINSADPNIVTWVESHDNYING